MYSKKHFPPLGEVLFYVFYSTISASSRSRIAWSALQK